MKFTFLIFAGAGILLLAISGLLYLGEANFLSRAVPATGTVTDLERSSSSEGGYSYCPVIQFTSRDGQVVSYEGNVCSDPPAYAIGDRVELVYDPEDPEHVQMDNFWSKYVAVFVTGVIGAPLTLVGLIGLIGSRLRRGASSG